MAENTRGQSGQRQRTSLAIIVGAEQDQHVFHCHRDNQRPQDQRQHPQNRVECNRSVADPGPDGHLEGVEWAGADVAIDYPDTRKC